jgi:hypothetical protein
MYVPNFTHQILPQFRTMQNKAKEMEERKYEEGKNGCQEQGNAFNASFQTM